MPQFPNPLGGLVDYGVTVNEGAENDTAAGILRKHLNPALVGKAWDALVCAIATGDAANVAAAQTAFDQLFTISASGQYLEQRGADQGIQRPPNVGIPDPLFRQYIIRSSINQVTEESLLEILEVFYGANSVRAYADTGLAEPYGLTAGDDLTLVIDGDQMVLVVFDDEDFAIEGQATAAEVAAAINRVLTLNGLEAYALPQADPQTGAYTVRLYSGALGLGSSVQVTAGAAQPWLQFPQVVPAQLSAGPQWTLTFTAATGTLRFAPNGNFDVSQVQIGDYVAVYGQGFDEANRGSFQIINTYWAYPDGTHLVQYFEVTNLNGVAQASVVQGPQQDLMVFRPTRQTTHAGGGREVIIAVPGAFVDVVLPATSVAVGRQMDEAAYCQSNMGIAITALTRTNGTVSITTFSPHGLSVGSQVLIDGAYADTASPSTTAGGNGYTESNPCSVWSTMDSAPNDLGYQPASVLLPDGRALVVGGSSSDSFGPITTGAILDVTAVTPGPTGVVVSYNWTACSTLPIGAVLGALCVGPVGASLVEDAVYSGGFPVGSTALNTVYSFTGAGAGTWAALGSLNTARGAHTQVTIPSYGLFVAGGATSQSSGNSLSSTELYSATTNTWTTKASMGTARANHQAVVLSNGQVLVVGGRAITAGDPTAAYNPTTDKLLASCELYTPGTNTWAYSGRMSVARGLDFATILLPNDTVLAIGGVGYNLTQPPASLSSVTYQTTCELWERTTGRWRPISSIPVPGQINAVYLSDRQEVLATIANSAIYYILDTTTFKWRRATFNLPGVAQVYASMVALDDDLVLLAGGSLSGSTTEATNLYVPNADSWGGGGLNGAFEVLSVPSNATFTYATPQASYSSLIAGGSPTATPVAAVADNLAGPFTFDVTDEVAITEYQSPLNQTIATGHQYATITVDDATQFPDQPGWLVFGFGYDYQVGPVRYLGRLSTTTLSLDYKFRFTANVPMGAQVCLLANKGPYVPPSPTTVGSFYLTASAAGLEAAESAIAAAVGAGIVVNTTVTYPGDRGLGGEGLPATGASKLSDEVEVWGSDDVDQDYATARGPDAS